MQFIEAKAIVEVQVSWNAKIVMHPEDGVECLYVDGCYYMPVLGWAKYEEKTQQTKNGPKGTWTTLSEVENEPYLEEIFEACEIREISKPSVEPE